MNEIILLPENCKWIRKVKLKRQVIHHFSNSYQLNSSKFIGHKISIMCSECHNYSEIKFYNKLLLKPYLCMSCNKKGTKNPFYGKTHNDITKKNIGYKNTKCGIDNPFYNKKHSNITKKQISDKLKDFYKENDNSFKGCQHSKQSKIKMSNSHKKYWNDLGDEQKKLKSELSSHAQRKLFKENPDKYIQQRKYAGKISHINNNRYKINKIEQKVLDYISQYIPNIKYGVILDKYQFDLGIKEKKILIEVHGDYWHGNPKLYNKNGTHGKRALNKIQLNKKKKDQEKLKFCQKHNIKLYIIWEHDIKNNNYSSLKDILNEI